MANNATLGSLVVSLEANIAQFEANMQKAESAAKVAMEGVQKAAELAKTALGALGVALTANAFYEGIKGAVEMMDNLDKLSQRTGVAVESLSAMKTSAKFAEVSMDDVGAAIQKLSKNMVDFQSTGTGKAAQAFETLGIKVTDSNGKLREADQIMLEAAQKLDQFKDGAGKTAIEIELFGKAGANLGGFLKELAERGLDNAKVTAQQAAEAAKFEDNLKRLQGQSRAVYLSIAQELTPSLVALTDKMVEFSKGSSVLKTVFDTIFVLGANVAYVFKEIGVEIGGIAAQLNALAHGDFKAFSFIGDQMKKDAAAARKEIDDFSERIINGDKAAAKATPKVDDKKDLAIPADPSKIEGILKARLDAQLALENSLVSQEQQLLADRNKILDQYYSDNLISIRDYYNGKDNAQKENLTRTLADYDAEIAALRKFQQQAAGPTASVDRINAEKQITEIIQKKNALEQQAAAANSISALKEIKDKENYAKSIEDVNARVLELSGNLREAALISFDRQNEQLKARFSAEGNAQALAQLDTLRKFAVAQGEVNDLEQKFKDIREQEAIVEARIQLSLQSGAISELESMRQLEVARRKEADDLQAIADKMQVIAQRDGFPKLVLEANQFTLAVDQLRAQTELTAQRFNQVFTSSFSSAFADAISGTKSLTDAFRAMTDDIVRQINRLAAEDLANKLFGGNDSSGGIGGFISNLLGGQSYTSEGVQYDPTNYSSGTGGGLMSSIKDWWSSLPSYDVGTDYVPNDMIAMIHQGEKIIPAAQNDGSYGAITNHINITVSGQVDSRTTQQIASEVATAVARASKRNN